MIKYPFLTLLIVLAEVHGASAAGLVVRSQQHDFSVDVVAEGLDHPWSLAFVDPDTILVTQRSGDLRLIRNRKLQPRPVPGVPRVMAEGQGGLLDIALHPEFESNRLIYLSFTSGDGDGYSTEVARGRWTGTRLEDMRVLFRAEPRSTGGRHFGSRLLFAPDGGLYITLGDRGIQDQAQDPGTHHGSVIRLWPDGGVPADNPFVDAADARPEIYSYGHRNIQGIALQPGTRRIWTHEHGPQGGDEVNILEAGVNFGWPVVTYGRNYGTGTRIGEGTHKPGMRQPLIYWVPSIAPSGMAFYHGDRFPDWRGDLFVGSLKFGLLVRLEVEDDKIVREERMLDGRFGRIRDVRNGPDGYLYLLTDEYDGRLLRLTPAEG